MKSVARRVMQVFADRLADSLSNRTQDFQLELLGRMQAGRNAAKREIRHLSEVEFKVYSQWGEDGIIDWLVEQLDGIPQTFVEFGVEDYFEANTRFLLFNRNWSGLIMDGSAENMARCRRSHYYWKYGLKAVESFITAENINSVLSGNGFAGEIGILSVDIDGNDYWVWQAIDAVSPWIVIAEYNAVFGDLHPLSQPYQSDYTRFGGHVSGLYFGASIRALEHCAAAKGYTLLGSNLAGNNAFFVRNDLLTKFAGVADRRALPSRFRDARDANGRLTFAQGKARAELISACKVVDVVAGETRPLGEYGELYSPDWQG